MPAQPLDELGAADDDPRLRPAEQLVAGEADEVGAGGQALARRRLALEVDEHAGAEVVHERQAVPPGDRGQLGHRRLLGEADDAEVRLVHAQQHGRLGADRALVVGGTRAVRRADLAQPRAGAGEHVGDAEAVADLDQLAARDEHLAALRQARRARAAPRPRCCSRRARPRRRSGGAGSRRRGPAASRARRPGGRTRGSSSRARSRPPARAPPPAGAPVRGSCARSRPWHSACAAARAPGPPRARPAPARPGRRGRGRP